MSFHLYFCFLLFAFRLTLWDLEVTLVIVSMFNS